MPIFGTIVADGTAATSSKQRDLTIPLLLVVAVAILVLPQILNGKTTNMAQSQADESSDTLMAIDLVGGSIPAVVYSEEELKERAANVAEEEAKQQEEEEDSVRLFAQYGANNSPPSSRGEGHWRMVLKRPFSGTVKYRIEGESAGRWTLEGNVPLKYTAPPDSDGWNTVEVSNLTTVTFTSRSNARLCGFRIIDAT